MDVGTSCGIGATSRGGRRANFTQDLRFDQGGPDSPATQTHAARDRADRNATQMQPHGLSCFLDSQPRTTPRHAAPREVRRHRGAMHAVPICQLLDGRAVEVVTDKPVDLGGGEKGLKMFNPPNHGAPRVLHQGGFRALGHPVDAALPACGQGL